MRVLVLGGTRAALTVAERIDRETPARALLSLAGRTEHPDRGLGDVRIGGFGGAMGLTRYLHDAKIDGVIDATHPYAARMCHHAADACLRSGVPLIALHREPWLAQRGDRFIPVPNLEAAAAAVCAYRRIFLTVGRQELLPFASSDRWFLIRSIDAPTEPLPHASHVILARGPFTFESDLALMRTYAIDCVVAKNSGGAATYAKIQAARERAIPVVLVDRPTRPQGVPTFTQIDEIIAWVSA